VRASLFTGFLSNNYYEKDYLGIITTYRGAIEFSAETETIARQNQLEPFQSEGGR
jgi:hypothetical protein